MLACLNLYNFTHTRTHAHTELRSYAQKGLRGKFTTLSSTRSMACSAMCPTFSIILKHCHDTEEVSGFPVCQCVVSAVLSTVMLDFLWVDNRACGDHIALFSATVNVSHRLDLSSGIYKALRVWVATSVEVGGCTEIQTDMSYTSSRKCL